MTEWIIPCDPNKYKVEEAFKKLGTLDWKQTNPKIEVGDVVYIYVSHTVKAIMYKCLVTKAGLDHVEINDLEFATTPEVYETYPVHMELKLLETYNKDKYTLDLLKQHGLKVVRGAQRMKEETSKFVKM